MQFENNSYIIGILLLMHSFKHLHKFLSWLKNNCFSFSAYIILQNLIYLAYKIHTLSEMDGEVIINLSQGNSASAPMIFWTGKLFIAGEAILCIVWQHSGLLPNRCNPLLVSSPVVTNKNFFRQYQMSFWGQITPRCE